MNCEQEVSVSELVRTIYGNSGGEGGIRTLGTGVRQSVGCLILILFSTSTSPRSCCWELSKRLSWPSRSHPWPTITMAWNQTPADERQRVAGFFGK